MGRAGAPAAVRRRVIVVYRPSLVTNGVSGCLFVYFKLFLSLLSSLLYNFLSYFISTERVCTLINPNQLIIYILLLLSAVM